MVVLWIMVLLSALATEYLMSMKTEVHTTRNFKEDIESYQLAKAGINLAMAELMKTAVLLYDFYCFIDYSVYALLA